MPRKRKKEKEDIEIVEDLSEELKKDDSAKYISFNLSNKSKKIVIHDGMKETEYTLVRWRYGDELDTLSKCTRVNRATKMTDIDIKEYNILMIMKTVRKPKLSKQEIENLDPRVGKALADECMLINNPDVDFTNFLARLPENQ